MAEVEDDMKRILGHLNASFLSRYVSIDSHIYRRILIDNDLFQWTDYGMD